MNTIGLCDYCYAFEQQTMLNSTTKHVKSKCVSILTHFSLKNEKVLDYFYSHQSKTAHALNVEFSTTLAIFVYAGKSCAVLEYDRYHKISVQMCNRFTYRTTFFFLYFCCFCSGYSIVFSFFFLFSVLQFFEAIIFFCFLFTYRTIFFFILLLSLF